MLLTGLGLILFSLMIGHPADANPYLWNQFDNLMYFTYIRGCYVLALILTILPQFLGQAPVLHAVLCGSNVRALGKVTMAISLTYPVVIMAGSGAGQEEIWLTQIAVLWLAAGSLLMT